jgi:hypothetical protein
MRRLFPIILLAVLPIACNRAAPPAAVSGPQSSPGWLVRYNAAAALARRGSDKAVEEPVRGTLLDMLDEDQQMRNNRETKDGKEVTDIATAQLTVVTTLKALTELHHRRPELDLAPFKPAVDKLKSSPSLAVSTEAKKAEQIFAAK